MNPPNNSILYKAPEGYRRTMAMYDRGLSEITAPVETRYVDTPTGVTHVVISGPEDAPPVFLLHGMSANAITWVNQINALAPHYRVYAPDMPGSMGRSAPVRISREGSAYGDWLSQTVDVLGVERASFIGISFGSWLALKLATVAPEKIASALLMSSAGFVPQSNKVMLKMLPRLIIMPFFPLEKRAMMFLEVMGVPGYKPSPGEVEMFGLLLAYFKYDQRAPDPHSDADLRCMTAPTAILYGEHEAAFDRVAAMKRAQALLPNLVHHEVVMGVGHGMTGEDVEGVNARILAFLADYSGRDAANLLRRYSSAES